jgi:hypothetical protein
LTKIVSSLMMLLALPAGSALAQAPPAPAPPPAAPASAPAAPAADPVRPVVLPFPDKNPFACDGDTAPAIVTRDLPSGIETTIPAFVSVRLDRLGKIEEVLLVHDPIPSLEAQQRESFKKWEFMPPKKTSLEVAGWSTVRLDLKFEFSRPQVARADFVPVTASTPVPPAHASRWDEGWIETAPPLSDLHGAEAVEVLDAPPLPKKTKWYADRFKGPFETKVWVEVSPAGKATRVVPVELKDPGLLAYLKAAISRWTFTPAKKGSQAISCWGMLDLAGTISYDISLTRAAAIKKSAGL